MTTKEKLTRRVIELIHDLPYEECLRFEEEIVNEYTGVATHNHYITLSRIMQALANRMTDDVRFSTDDEYLSIYDSSPSSGREEYRYFCDWKLTTKDGQTATLDDQTDETIESLYQLIK